MDVITLTPLKRILHPKGDIFHAMKASDIGFSGFGEAYFSTILKGEVKGWKKHTMMAMNIVVPLGMVRFYIYDEVKKYTMAYEIGINNYQRLTIPSGYWVAFEGLILEQNLVLNIANIEHDKNESINTPLETYPLGF
jgi:dTDP-4-dehydrorhamnose 3,5-epimerase